MCLLQVINSFQNYRGVATTFYPTLVDCAVDHAKSNVVQTSSWRSASMHLMIFNFTANDMLCIYIFTKVFSLTFSYFWLIMNNYGQDNKKRLPQYTTHKTRCNLCHTIPLKSTELNYGYMLLWFLAASSFRSVDTLPTWLEPLSMPTSCTHPSLNAWRWQ